MSEIYLTTTSPQSEDNRSQRGRPRRRTWWRELLKFFGIFAGIFIVLAGVVMGPTLYTTYSYNPAENEKKADLPSNVGSELNEINDLVSFVDSRPFEDRIDSIVIPKINVDAPLVYPENSDNVTILESIKNGVAHYPETALPGRLGNSFMTGHSSYYWWNGGKYNNVFALLDKLEVGDLVYVYYKNNKYIYRVSGSVVVRPDQVEVLNNTENATLSLMTCVPVGTNLRRLVVKADLIGHPPVLSTDFAPIQQIPKLPTILPLY